MTRRRAPEPPLPPAPTPFPTDRAARALAVKNAARALGCDLVGISSAAPAARIDFYNQWIAAGRHGSMHYLTEHVNVRADPRNRYPWLRTIISVAVAYHTPEQAGTPTLGKIARYARGRDYHRTLNYKLKRLKKFLLRHIAEPFEAKKYVDTGPLLERELAVNAGLGWVGKHTLLIHPRHGSWFLLGELLTSLDLETDSPIADHCGSCTRCVAACPTQAITPYSVDASLCLSYQTIENDGEIPASLEGPLADAGYLVGCDICQEVCPFNRRPLEATDAGFLTGDAVVDPRRVIDWTEDDWNAGTEGKAYRRVTLPMWQRNARVLLRPVPAPRADAGSAAQ